MDTIQPGPLVLRIGKLSIVCLLLCLLVAIPAWADVGVQPILPGGSNLQPEGDTPIQMTAEVVTMNVRLATEADNAVVRLNPQAYGYQSQTVWFPAVAEVQADFTMNNPTREVVSMTAWFPLASVLKTYGWEEISPEEIVPRIESFLVEVDGSPIEYRVSELPNPNGADKPNLPWASFPVIYPAGKETMIHVSYMLPLHQLPKSDALALYYIFQTGAGWSGSIGQAELILNLPYPASGETLAGMPSGSLNPPYFVYSGDEVAGLPPGGVFEVDQARWTWKDFEPGPDDDFSILLIHPESWNELQDLRAAVNITPEYGQAWLNLCSNYYNRSRNWSGVIPLSYNETYQSMGMEACEEAAHFLPGDALPHYLLAGFYLSALQENPSPETLQPVWIELKIAQELEAIQAPSEAIISECWDYSSNSECIEAIIANIYPYAPNPEWSANVSKYINNVIGSIASSTTATAEWAARVAETATEAAELTSISQSSTPLTPTKKPASTPTPVSSAALQVLPTATFPAAARSSGQSLLLSVIVTLVVLLAVGVMIVRRLRGSVN